MTRSAVQMVDEVMDLRQILKDVLVINTLREKAITGSPYDAILQMEMPLQRILSVIESRMEEMKDEADGV